MPTNPSTHLTPRIAITVGDVAGVGPELALRCVENAGITDRCLPIVLGPAPIMARIADRLGLSMPPVAELAAVGSVAEPAVIDCGDVSDAEVQPGQFSAATGKASFQAVTQAIDLAVAGKVDAIVTGPIQKEAWHDAQLPFLGHTELLADRTGRRDHCMMLTSDTISCVLATIHIPLADVSKHLTQDAVSRAIRLAGDALRRKLGRDPRIAVCGLNPHAGENGLFSHGEETDVILPAIQEARGEGMDVIGPLPPDTAFTPARRADTDVYVCMYHDQGLIPLKALAFDDAVNVTLGLPIVRTSVDHGTALDLAWQGVASDRSMLAAINMAADLCGAS